MIRPRVASPRRSRTSGGGSSSPRACATSPARCASFAPRRWRGARRAVRQWSVPHLNGHPYLDKPVLLFWMIAGAFRVLGVSELAARLPSVLGALATVLFTYDLVRVLAGRRRALLAAAVLATAPIVLAYARLVIFDMPLTALVTAALDCLVRARTEGNAWRWLPLAGLAMGLAALTKGPVGIAVPLLAWFAARGALARPRSE